MPDKPITVDAVVVGAGPAGSAAALELAKAGRDVIIVERGPFPGAKNVYGGVVYGRILDEIVPQWWTEVPVQRWVTRRSTMLMTPTQALTVDYRTSAWAGVISMVERRVTHRCTGTSVHHCGMISSRIRS